MIKQVINCAVCGAEVETPDRRLCNSCINTMRGIGKVGGSVTLERHGKEFFTKIGEMGRKARKSTEAES